MNAGIGYRGKSRKQAVAAQINDARESFSRNERDFLL
jgi:hypothetical protein